MTRAKMLQVRCAKARMRLSRKRRKRGAEEQGAEEDGGCGFGFWAATALKVGFCCLEGSGFQQ